ncbi:MAG: Uma2 family endonuclease [Bacteroidota bacterium]|nr:Uma2 family endonuclease [Bacteroidota bacterium]
MEVREPAVAYSKRRISIEEYLEMENASIEKHEYYKGEVFARPLCDITHNIVTVNLLGIIGSKLKKRPCRAYSSDQRVHIQSNTLFTYPDISIICGEITTVMLILN